MSSRIANIIILCEDQEQQNLVRRYLLRAGHGNRSFRFQPLPGSKQSGSQYVREQFPMQVVACRQMNTRTECLLIVVTDADNLSVVEREQTLHNQLQQAGHNPFLAAEPIVILIPKWQIETWIKCLLGQTISEGDRNSDRPPVDAAQIRQAAGTLFEWARPNAHVGTNCVPSLAQSLPNWRRLG